MPAISIRSCCTPCLVGPFVLLALVTLLVQPAIAQTARQASANNGQASGRQLPPGFPNSPEMDQYVGQLLDYWQSQSEKVQSLRSEFIRFDYDTSVVNIRDANNQPAAYQKAFGEIRYAAKDRAMFETRKVVQFESPAASPGEEATYKAIEGYQFFGKEIYERWMCDGKSFYSFDFENKRLNETRIPTELQGNVVESPVPFLFGANKQDILTRYWVRYVPKYRKDANGQQQLVEDEYWLEAFPKKIGDARMYSKMDIILERDTCMPKAIHLYSANYNPKNDNFASQYFVFRNQQINSQRDKMQDFMNLFVKPRLPMGWKSIEVKMGEAQADAGSREALRE